MRVSTSSSQRPSMPEIKKIFKSAMAAGLILPEVGQGLMIVFNKRADLCAELAIDHPSSHIINEALFELTEAFGFVVLKNCSAQTIPHDPQSKLSQGKNSDSNFLQDPYHYDVPPDNLTLRRREYMTGIYKVSPAAREMDTICVLEADVKEAIPKLDTQDLSFDVIDALDDMARPDYHFRLYHKDETIARDVIRYQYPQFVEDVYALIPEGRKYRQKWLQDQWDILVMANVHSNWLHARPTGYALGYNERPINPLKGLYLERD